MILKNKYTSLGQIIFDMVCFIHLFIPADKQMVFLDMLHTLRNSNDIKAFCMLLHDFTTLPKHTTEQQLVLEDYLNEWAYNYAQYAELC
jgi:hypothetical protein